jgi:uncharacterized protein YceK
MRRITVLTLVVAFLLAGCQAVIQPVGNAEVTAAATEAALEPGPSSAGASPAATQSDNVLTGCEASQLPTLDPAYQVPAFGSPQFPRIRAVAGVETDVATLKKRGFEVALPAWLPAGTSLQLVLFDQDGEGTVTRVGTYYGPRGVTEKDTVWTYLEARDRPAPAPARHNRCGSTTNVWRRNGTREHCRPHGGTDLG